MLKNTAIFISLCFVWGSTWSVIFLGLNDSLPLWSAAARFFIAGAIFVLARMFHGSLALTRDLLGVSVIYGILYFCIPFGVVYWAEQFIPTSLVAVLAASAPIMILIGERILFGTPTTALQVVGAAMAFGGVALLFWSEISFGASVLYIVALIATFAGMIALAAATLIIRPFVKLVSVAELNGGAMLVAGCVLGLLSALVETGPRSFYGQNLAALLYLAFIGSVYAFWAYLILIGSWGAGRASTILFVAPVVALYIGALFLGETLALTTYAGTILVIIGTALVILTQVSQNVMRSRRI